MSVQGIVLAIGLSVGIVAAGTAYAGPPGGPDTDGDGFPDVFDNCTAAANATQADTDHNGCGNTCELLCDKVPPKCVGVPEFLAMGPAFGMAGLMDCDGDTIVGAPDFLILGMEFGMCPGPSGIAAGGMGMAPAPLCDSASCCCPGDPSPPC